MRECYIEVSGKIPEDVRKIVRALTETYNITADGGPKPFHPLQNVTGEEPRRSFLTGQFFQRVPFNPSRLRNAWSQVLRYVPENLAGLTAATNLLDRKNGNFSTFQENIHRVDGLEHPDAVQVSLKQERENLLAGLFK